MTEQLGFDFVPVIARGEDPETSHEAAEELEGDQARLSRCIALAEQLLKDHGPMTDFDLESLWGQYWPGDFSESLPRKARHWARQAGRAHHYGYGKHNGRRVRTWAAGPGDEK